MKKKRLDEILIERGMVKDKKEAFIAVTGGDILVRGRKAISPAEMFSPDTPLSIRERSPYVGRGGFKLAAALDHFGISPNGKVCADIGAATGGFTDVMLKRGAARVYAIDVGTGKLALKLREDPRVVVMEGINILYLEALAEPIDLATIDLSFTSLRLVMPKLTRFLKPKGEVIALFKPQYEVAEHELKHGIVADGEIRGKSLADFESWVKDAGWKIRGLIESPIKGAKGNREYLLWLMRV